MRKQTLSFAHIQQYHSSFAATSTSKNSLEKRTTGPHTGPGEQLEAETGAPVLIQGRGAFPPILPWLQQSHLRRGRNHFLQHQQAPAIALHSGLTLQPAPQPCSSSSSTPQCTHRALCTTQGPTCTAVLRHNPTATAQTPGELHPVCSWALPWLEGDLLVQQCPWGAPGSRKALQSWSTACRQVACARALCSCTHRHSDTHTSLQPVPHKLTPSALGA